jgi:hypothetical protein
VVVPFTTYQAYNQWPYDGVVGRSLYYGFAATGDNEERRFTDDPARRAVKVSFDRPFPNSGIPSQADYDFNFIEWFEGEGYDATYVTSIDLHRGLVDPRRFAGLIFSGHDEYWSGEMRDVVERAVVVGTSLGFMSANNIYWHVRLEPSQAGKPERVMTCYKTAPDPEAEPGQWTTKWRTGKTGPGKAEQAVLGVQYKSVVPEPMPLVITNADHWIWSASGAGPGDELVGVVAGEADNLDPKHPKPRGAQTLLSESPYTMTNGTPAVQNTSIYEARSGATVFVAGTFHWTFGLSHEKYRDQRIRVATSNLVRRMLAGSRSMSTFRRAGRGWQRWKERSRG